MPAKPTLTEGYKTTEFWVTIVTIICATVLAAMDSISGQAWALAVGVNGAGYSLSRGVRKMNVGAVR